MAPSLERGLGYLALDPEDTASAFLRTLAQARTPFLWITADPRRDTAEGGDVLRVTTLRRLGSADPRRLREIRAAATTFFDERGPGALVLDCLELLTLHSGVERVLRFVDDLHEETAMRNAFLVVFADPKGMNRRMIAWLERELDPLPRGATPEGVEDHLVV
ncbi:MAG TPA: DUF835 domain-containing protein [Thermoplasmata archaeon]|nr:DUF835 domain-containing protein [Thermoplasmata archaeon]